MKERGKTPREQLDMAEFRSWYYNRTAVTIEDYLSPRLVRLSTEFATTAKNRNWTIERRQAFYAELDKAIEAT